MEVTTLPENFLCALNVGHGNSTVIRSNGQVGIIDGGESTHLLHFLNDHRIYNIEYIFISHSDKDHISGLLKVLCQESFTVEKVYLNSDALKDSKLWEDLAYEIQSQRRHGKLKLSTSLQEGNDFKLGSVKLSTLTPSSALTIKGPGAKTREGLKITSNSISAAIRVISEKSTILLASDIDQISIDESNPTATFRSDILIYPHHGGISSNTNEEFAKNLLSKVQPRYVVFSNGRNKFNNPRREVVEAVQSKCSNAQIICTQLANSCAKQYPSHFKEAESLSCGGNILVDLLNGEIHTTNTPDHIAQVRDHIPRAICQSCGS